ncbi:potassium channel family protein [Demequina sp. NBRC 110053]|uniref:potassium channel family protein n=1 Tax=Demequina sp. NBRC 110053 TaxID=1570342 RepID=UPI0009FF9126|nr:potassium channel family protein [Demequina sp. NBRC 110053]
MAEPMGERYDAYARRTDPWMLALALVFLVVWSGRVIFHDDMHPVVDTVTTVALTWIWVAFVVDIVVRTIISKKSWRYLWTHPIDVFAVLYPPARPLKILTVFTEGTALASTRGRVQTSQAVAVSVVLLLWIGSVAMLSAERGKPDAQIESFGDAVWWAIVTVTTVGYGDFAPVTVTGRVIAGIMMLIGIALIGVVTASVAAWFVQLTSSGEDADEEEREVDRHHQLLERIERLEAKIDGLAERGPSKGQ